MKNYKFRSVAEWRDCVATLPDAAFFELMRSVFGNVKTPFNKHRLIEDLCTFLSKDDIKALIKEYLDEDDHKVIAAVALLNEPDLKEIETFFTGELPTGDLHAKLINLEERLVLYRVNDEGKRRIALNPALESILTPFVNDPSPLFPTVPADSDAEPAARGPASRGFAADNRILARLCAFLSAAGEPPGGLFRLEGGLRKKFVDRSEKFFPGGRLEPALAILRMLRLFLPTENGVEADEDSLRSFAALEGRDRGAYWAAALLFSGMGSRDSGNDYIARGAVRSLAVLIHRFIGQLDAGLLYPKTTLIRLAALTLRDMREGSWGLWLPPDRGKASDKAILERLFDVLKEAGLVERLAGGMWRLSPEVFAETGGKAKEEPEKMPWETESDADEDDEAAETAEPAKPVITMDTPFSMLLFPEIASADALELALFCCIAEPAETGAPEAASPDALVRFEITKDSAVKGFDRGLTAEGMLELLNRLSGGLVDSTLEWTLKDWETRYAQVSLSEGLVLTLTGEAAHIAETMHIASMIRRTLAPGLYLLSPKDKAEVLRSLEKAGAMVVARPKDKKDRDYSGGLRSLKGESVPRLFSPRVKREVSPASSGVAPASSGVAPAGSGGAPASSGVAPAGSGGAPGGPGSGAEAVKQRFRNVLAGMKLTKNEREELAARIERRLILTESQLEGAEVRFEKLEARGLDYPGKTLVAKQAVLTGSLLDVTYPGPKGEIRRKVGYPEGVENKGEENVLILKHGDGETLRIPIGKISVLRRVKQSIFGD
ncbi:MAG: helicase-associated domain-containing protein/consreved hypothetical protein AEF82474.1 [Treponematales bacterium]